MQFIVISLSLLMATAVLGYDEKYDKVDVDKILNDNTLLTSYANCLLDKGPCTLEYSSDYKDLLPEILADACAKCSKIQRSNIRKILNELYKNNMDLLVAIRDKYDPKGEYEQNIKKILEED